MRSGAFNYSLRTISPLVSFGDYISEYLFASPFPLHTRGFHRSVVSIHSPPSAAFACSRRIDGTLLLLLDCCSARSKVNDPSVVAVRATGRIRRRRGRSYARCRDAGCRVESRTTSAGRIRAAVNKRVQMIRFWFIQIK